MNLSKRKTTTQAATTTAESLPETTSTFESPVVLPIVDEDGSGDDLIAAPMEVLPEQRGYIQNFIDEMQSLKDELKDVDWSSIKKKVLIA